MTTANKMNLFFRAGDCKFFSTKHPNMEASLEDQGYMPFARAPREFFEPNIQALAREPHKLGQLADVIKDYDDSQLRILMYVLKCASELKQLNLNFGEPVYINLSSPHADYVDCWFRAYVMCPGPEAGYVFIAGTLDGENGTLMLVPIENILQKVAFINHHRSLVKAGKLRAPKIKKAITHSIIDPSQVPSIEEVADRLEDTTDDHEVGRKKSSKAGSYKLKTA